MADSSKQETKKALLGELESIKSLLDEDPDAIPTLDSVIGEHAESVDATETFADSSAHGEDAQDDIPTLTPIEDIPTLEAVEEEQIRQRKLDAAFSELSELCQKLLRLLVSGVSSTEAAAQLGMANANTVYRRKNACVGRWKTLYHAQN